MKIPVLVVLSVLLSLAIGFDHKANGQSVNLDLGSSERTLVDSGSSHTATILVDGRPTQVSAGSALTPAERTALTQVIQSGRQSLFIGANGAATGGTVLLDAAVNLHSLMVPSGVTAIHDASHNPAFNVMGNITNAGSIFAISTNPAVTAASIGAQNIVNQRDALLSTVLPSGGLPGYLAALNKLDLTVTAVNELVNEGTLSSSGSLTINSPLINNRGTIAAYGGNLNISAPGAQSIVINGQGGLFSASDSINVRDAAFAESANLTINGGDFIANSINLYSGNGAIRARMGEVSGTLSTYANYAHVGAATDVLTLGEINITGDPTYFNPAGDINITGNIQVAETLSIIASKDIKTSAGVTLIQARDGSGQGFDINLVAGANVSGTGDPTATNITPAVTEATGDVTVDGASATGGNVDLSASNLLSINANSTCTNCDGGSVAIAAFAGGANTGRISLHQNSTVRSSSNGTGTAGNITMVAGATADNAILTGSLLAGSGDIGLATAQPQSSDGNPVIFAPNGSISSNNSIVPGPSLTSASIDVEGSISGRDIFVLAGEDIDVESVNARSIFLSSLGGTVQNFGELNAESAITFSGPVVSLSSEINAPAVTIVGSPNGFLYVSGNAQILSLMTTITSLSGKLQFATNSLEIVGPAYFASTESINIPLGVDIMGASLVQLTTPVLSLQGTLTGNGIYWTNQNDESVGTILNPDGDVRIPANLNYSGKNLAILASRDIIAAPGVTSIKLSSSTGNGGSLIMIAGQDFVLSGTLDPATASLTPVTGTGYTLTGPSVSGGSILLPAVNIDTGSTSTNADANDAGSITLVAQSGIMSAGIVSVGNVSAKSTRGTGGFIHIIGDGGIQTKSITNASASGNSIFLSAARPRTIGPEIQLQNGILSGLGIISSHYISSTDGASITVAGSISTAASKQQGGELVIRADGTINIKGPINTTGTAQSLMPFSPTGGRIYIASNRANITTGGIDTSAKTINSFYPSGGLPGLPGPISISAASGVQINGNVVANGASTSVPGKIAGAGGFVTIEASNNAPENMTGALVIKGFVSAKGGRASTNEGVGGQGGLVALAGNTVQVLGASGGNSINASYGDGVYIYPSSGQVAISTNNMQPFPTNFDLNSGALSVTLMPGSIFTVGASAPINGTAGKILARFVDGSVQKTDLPSAGLLAPSSFNQKGVAIDVLGSTSISIDQGTSSDVVISSGSATARTLTTPAIAVAAFQQQNGQTPIMINANATASLTGNTVITVDQTQLPGAFKAFKLPDGFTLNVTGDMPILSLPAGAVIGGNIHFAGGVLAPTAMIDFGSTIGSIPSTGKITTVDGSRLILSTSAATIKNQGLIQADVVMFAHTATGVLTVLNTGASANIDADAIVLTESASPTVAYTFKSEGAPFTTKFAFLPFPLPTRFDRLAANFAKHANINDPLNLTIGLVDVNGNPITATIGGVAAVGNATITTLAMKVNDSTVLTPLSFEDNIFFASNGTLKVTSAGELSFNNSTHVLSTNNALFTAPSITFTGNNNIVTAGGVTPSAGGTGVLAKAALTFAGSLTLKATGIGGIDILGTGTRLVSHGKNVTLTAVTGDIGLGTDTVVKANGGNVSVFALGEISDNGSNVYHARALEGAPTTGGIHFASGLTASTALGGAFSKPAGVVNGFNPTGIPVSGISGVFWVKTKDGGVVNLADPSPSTVQFNRGAMLFESVGSNGAINLSGATFITDGIKPISNTLVLTAPDFVVDTADDADFAFDEQLTVGR